MAVSTPWSGRTGVRMPRPRIKPEHAPYRISGGRIRLGGVSYGIAAEVEAGGTGRLLAGFWPMRRWQAPVLGVPYPISADLHLGGRGLVLIPSYFFAGPTQPSALRRWLLSGRLGNELLSS